MIVNDYPEDFYKVMATLDENLQCLDTECDGVLLEEGDEIPSIGEVLTCPDCGEEQEVVAVEPEIALEFSDPELEEEIDDDEGEGKEEDDMEDFEDDEEDEEERT